MIRSTTGRVVVVATAALLGALVAWWAAPGSTPTAFSELPRAAELAAPRAEPVGQRELTGRRGTASPRRLTLPRLGVSLPVRPVGVDAVGRMALPETAYAAGWYRFGSGPLTGRGATVIAGHVDTRSEGVGPWARLAAAGPGDLVAVAIAGRTVRYRVTAVQRIAQGALDLPRLFSRSGPPRLHLVTCGGEYDPDRGGYQDNVVLTASPV